MMARGHDTVVYEDAGMMARGHDMVVYEDALMIARGLTHRVVTSGAHVRCCYDSAAAEM